MPEVTLAIGELVYIWSISVAVCSVILVGLVIIGRRLLEYNISKYCSVGGCVLYFKKSILISPHM